MIECLGLLSCGMTCQKKKLTSLLSDLQFPLLVIVSVKHFVMQILKCAIQMDLVIILYNTKQLKN